MKSKIKNKLLAFVKEAIRAAIAAAAGVAGAALAQEIRDAVAWITPTSLGAAAANGIVKISMAHYESGELVTETLIVPIHLVVE